MLRDFFGQGCPSPHKLAVGTTVGNGNDTDDVGPACRLPSLVAAPRHNDGCRSCCRYVQVLPSCEETYEPRKEEVTLAGVICCDAVLATR